MKRLIVILLVVVLNSLANVCLSYGMREVGEVHPFDPLSTLTLGLHLLINPWIGLAMPLLLTYFLLYNWALSWIDLSYMLPMTSSGYVLSTLFAWLLLSEKIVTTRWIGILTIALGVLVVGYGKQKTGDQRHST